MRSTRLATLTLVGLAMTACSSPHSTDYNALFKATTFSLPEAIDRALAVNDAKGCTVVNAEIEEEGGKIIYSMELANGNKILEINFDVTNGAMLPLETEDHDKSAQAKAARISVKQAIEIATKNVEGKPIEASLLLKDGKPVCDVKVFTHKGKVRTVSINAETGEIKMIIKEAKKDKAGEPKDKED